MVPRLGLAGEGAKQSKGEGATSTKKRNDKGTKGGRALESSVCPPSQQWQLATAEEVQGMGLTKGVQKVWQLTSTKK